MCSIIKYKNCIGRNFDYEISYNEQLRIISRNQYDNKYEIVGMCTGIVEDYPLLYDGMNEYGLVCGGLAFSGNAVYNNPKEDMLNIPSWKFPLFILSECKSVNDAEKYLGEMNITNISYSEEMPPSDLHWFIADSKDSIIVEQTSNGLNYYTGDVMTNNPPFPLQEKNCDIKNRSVGSIVDLAPTFKTRGMETIGLNGDYTSSGRFQRLTYLKDKMENSSSDMFNPVGETFNLLSSVLQVYGATQVGSKFEYTIYSVVYDLSDKSVYLKFYDELLYSKGVIRV